MGYRLGWLRTFHYPAHSSNEWPILPLEWLTATRLTSLYKPPNNPIGCVMGAFCCLFLATPTRKENIKITPHFPVRCYRQLSKYSTFSEETSDCLVVLVQDQEPVQAVHQVQRNEAQAAGRSGSANQPNLQAMGSAAADR